ncbi:hypothetical protein [Sphingomonas sp. Mn802worker]|uniref:hypothetical protein n=1 Tax=Sphingomonas sp. Mn802worker TaxID=629773 RepID=UPI000381C238|nr:hypothetical protein [Sphingomonas sp. Mn802worker]
MSDPAGPRWAAITGVRIAGSFGAVLGVILTGRAETTGPKVLGVAIVLAALWMLATVPKALAARWRSPQ